MEANIRYICCWGGGNYITIGNFNNDATTDTLKVHDSVPTDAAYYFIDDVSVISIDSIPGGLTAYGGKDTLIAKGDSVFIGQEISNLNCNWYELGQIAIVGTGSGIYVKPDTTTTYIVEQTLCGTITYDTVVVSVKPVGINEVEKFGNSLSFFPNPAHEQVSILCSDKNIKALTVAVHELSGKQISKQNIQLLNNACSYNFNLPSGLYFLSLTDPEKKYTAVKKLVVY